jgi:hypothetical protein
MVSSIKTPSHSDSVKQFALVMEHFVRYKQDVRRVGVDLCVKSYEHKFEKRQRKATLCAITAYWAGDPSRNG